MIVDDWFDTNNLEHMKAFEYYIRNNKWPEHISKLKINPLLPKMIFESIGEELFDLKLEALTYE